MIHFLMNENVASVDIHKRMKSVYSESVMSVHSVQHMWKCMREFCDRWTNIFNEE